MDIILNEIEQQKDQEQQRRAEWMEQVQGLKEYFATMQELPQTFLLNSHTKIGNVALFLQSHLSIVSANAGKEVYRPYLQRLEQAAIIIERWAKLQKEIKIKVAA